MTHAHCFFYGKTHTWYTDGPMSGGWKYTFEVGTDLEYLTAQPVFREYAVPVLPVFGSALCEHLQVFEAMNTDTACSLMNFGVRYCGYCPYSQLCARTASTLATFGPSVLSIASIAHHPCYDRGSTRLLERLPNNRPP